MADSPTALASPRPSGYPPSPIHTLISAREYAVQQLMRAARELAEFHVKRGARIIDGHISAVCDRCYRPIPDPAAAAGHSQQCAVARILEYAHSLSLLTAGLVTDRDSQRPRTMLGGDYQASSPFRTGASAEYCGERSLWQPGQSDAHGPDAGGNLAKQGAPVERVEASQTIDAWVDRVFAFAGEHIEPCFLPGASCGAPDCLCDASTRCVIAIGATECTFPRCGCSEENRCASSYPVQGGAR